jgi:anion-transporting  ArsA/GET3 family ATPase
MKALLNNHKVIVCAGSGGVGKTTVSAALGLRAAQSGLKVLVLTVDPARRLAAALGIENTHGEVRVEIPDLQGTLYAEMIEPRRIFDDFIRGLAPSAAVAENILGNSFYQQLCTTLSGSQEFTSLVRLYDAAAAGKFDLVILDTPPAEHAIDFLQAPEKLSALFQGRVIRWFAGGQERLPLLTRLMNRSTRALFGTMELIAGSGFMGELRKFFEGLWSLVDDIGAASRRAHELLLSPETAFVLLTSLDQAKLQEAEEFRQELGESGYRLKAVIINRAYPHWFLENRSQTMVAMKAIGSPGLNGLYAEMAAFFDRRRALHGAFQALDGARVQILEIPEMDDDVHGLEALGRVAAHIPPAQTA